MEFRIAIAVFVLVVILIALWLVAEIRLDRKWQNRIKPTVPAPMERLPPNSDL